VVALEDAKYSAWSAKVESLRMMNKLSKERLRLAAITACGPKAWRQTPRQASKFVLRSRLRGQLGREAKNWNKIAHRRIPAANVQN
jgi:hypothetical protein